MVQIAKEAGLKVIASVGSEEKAAYVRSLGADVVFNYKTEDTSAVLEREGGIDMYVCSHTSMLFLNVVPHRFWDNVGGKTLEAALGAAHRHARFIVRCRFVEMNTKSTEFSGAFEGMRHDEHLHQRAILPQEPFTNYIPTAESVRVCGWKSVS